jgi:hypothetical protein
MAAHLLSEDDRAFRRVFTSVWFMRFETFLRWNKWNGLHRGCGSPKTWSQLLRDDNGSNGTNNNANNNAETSPGRRLLGGNVAACRRIHDLLKYQAEHDHVIRLLDDIHACLGLHATRPTPLAPTTTHCRCRFIGHADSADNAGNSVKMVKMVNMTKAANTARRSASLTTHAPHALKHPCEEAPPSAWLGWRRACGRLTTRFGRTARCRLPASLRAPPGSPR